MKRSRVRPGFKEIRLPGQRAFHSLHDSAAAGVQVEEAMIEI